MDVKLVPQWNALCQRLSSAFTRPTFAVFVQIVTSWALCRSRPLTTHLIRTIASSLLGHVARHWITYERFFYRARWSLSELSHLLIGRIVGPLIEQRGVDSQIDLAIDDTTCGRCGKHVACARYFKDASVSNTTGQVIHWAHNWVIACLTMRDKRWPDWVIGLPVLFTLYRKRPDCDRDHPFQTRQQIGARMIREAHAALPGRTIRIAADGQYATTAMVQAARESETNLVSRMRCDAAVYKLPPQHRKGRRGRPRKKGDRLPTPKAMAARRKKGWRTITVRAYGKVVERRVLPIICLWYHVAKDHPIKLLIIRDPVGKQDDDYAFCTDPETSDEEIVERFAARWPIEECIRDGKQHGGFEQVQGWCPRTVERQAPMALIVQTLVKAWYLWWGAESAEADRQNHPACGWMHPKDHPSYLDMLATLRSALWTHRLKCNSTLKGQVWKLLQPLRFTLSEAA